MEKHWTESFRIITPVTQILITVIVTLGMFILNDLKSTVKDMNSHFTNHLGHHQELEVGYERRLSILETRQK